MELGIGSTRLLVTTGDITREDTDAIANAANAALAGGGGVDGAIHAAAGPELLEACAAVRQTLEGHRLPTGQAVITPGFGLRARHVIHCVGPVYHHAGDAAAELLASCYRAALTLCREHQLSSIAFPAISTGIYGYPLNEAADVSMRALRDELEAHGAPRLVKMVLFDDRAHAAFEKAGRFLTPARPTP